MNAAEFPRSEKFTAVRVCVLNAKLLKLPDRRMKNLIEILTGMQRPTRVKVPQQVSIESISQSNGIIGPQRDDVSRVLAVSRRVLALVVSIQ